MSSQQTSSAGKVDGIVISDALQRALRELAAAWRRRLTSLDRRNPALYFRELKTGTLALGGYDLPAMTGLVDESRPLDIVDTLEWSDDSARRLAAIRAKARENEEERGIQTLFLAIGMASWKAIDGGRPPHAPLLFLPVKVVEQAKRPRLIRDGDLIVNRVMLQSWTQEHSLEVSDLDGDEAVDIPIAQACARLEFAGRQLEGFSATSDCYLSNFSFAKMAMVEDLRKNEQLLKENRLIRAIAGDREAQTQIKESSGTVDRAELDNIDPSDELIVLEADEYQRQAIHSLTRFESDGVVDGPPGTGKSQTIANLIATLVGSGKRVLFVAEKRAALDAVKNRLVAAGLADLVLDLHGADTTRKTVYDRLRTRDERARVLDPEPPAPATERLKELRTRLNRYYRVVNERRAACELSPREIIARLAAIDNRVDSRTMWFGNECESLDVPKYARARDALQILAREPKLFLRDPSKHWSRARFADQDAAAEALRFVASIRRNVDALRGHLAAAERILNQPAQTFEDLAKLCSSIRWLSEARAVYSDRVLDLNVDELARDLGPATKATILAWADWFVRSQYRRALRKAKAVSDGQPSRRTLAEAAATLARVPESSRVKPLFAAAVPEFVDRTRELWKAIARDRKLLEEMAFESLPADLNEAVLKLRELEDNNRDARRVPEIRSAESEFVSSGFERFLQEFTNEPPPAEHWVPMLESAWLESHLELAKTAEPLLGAFQRESHEHLLAEFRELDARHVTATRSIVRRAAAQLYLNARNTHQDQATKFRVELQKKARNMPVRRLVRETGNIVTSLCPCWMASPLSVSQLIAPETLFDVVIFDEASQVMPEDAIPSIMRGRRTIVAGDQKQLPPTAFFANSTLDPEDEEADVEDDPELLQISTAGLESVLDLMIGFCSRQYLNVHYRSLDESLIRFSNREFYQDRLITFPGPGLDDMGISHVLVDAPHVDGEELSSSKEIDRVVELILDHAEHRSSETLGVIALGIKHKSRIEAALDQERRRRTDLDDFFGRGDVNRAFFVKNLERVQGDERDAIILSMGYAQDASGRLKNKLGPLNHEGGDRRLNVAVTRSKTRMTVVSTFTEEDMERSRFSSQGAQRLCRYVEYARSGGKSLSDVSATDVELNDFERDIMDTLVAKGLRIVPQLGVSRYRLDLAVLHPTIPNRYVLAIECDGAPYHSSATARDRDRLRQRHLESLGWVFHRIWSSDWYEERHREIERALDAYYSVLKANNRAKPSADADAEDTTFVAPQNRPRRGQKPPIYYGEKIADFSDRDIRAIFDWIANDGILRSDEEMIIEAVKELRFARRGKAIDERLRRVVRSWRGQSQQGH